MSSWTDSRRGHDPGDSGSTNGYLVLMAGGPVAWKSTKKQSMALSSTKVEYMGHTYSDEQIPCAANEGQGLQHLRGGILTPRRRPRPWRRYAYSQTMNARTHVVFFGLTRCGRPFFTLFKKIRGAVEKKLGYRINRKLAYSTSRKTEQEVLEKAFRKEKATPSQTSKID